MSEHDSSGDDWSCDGCGKCHAAVAGQLSNIALPGKVFCSVGCINAAMGNEGAPPLETESAGAHYAVPPPMELREAHDFMDARGIGDRSMPIVDRWHEFTRLVLIEWKAASGRVETMLKGPE